jgi:Resolvase, N terminal domain
VDRLGRSLTDLLGILQELRDKGADLFLHQQGLDTSTTAGKAMFQMSGVFAEFERGTALPNVLVVEDEMVLRMRYCGRCRILRRQFDDLRRRILETTFP